MLGHNFSMAIDKKVLLEEAEAAYHALATGQAVAEVRDHNGETIRYFAPQMGRLRAYIFQLRAELGQSQGGNLAPARGWF